MWRRLERLVLAAAVVGLAVQPACLFDTRPAQPPSTGPAGCDVIVLDSADQAFVAITESLERCKADANYQRALSKQFVFSPTVADSLDQNFVGTGVFDNWTSQVELDVFNALLSDAKKSVVTFTPVAIINKNDFVRFRTPYTLDVVSKATPPDTTHYAGVAQIDVRNEGGIWRITFWDEVETVNGKTTWGYLRGVLRLRLNP